MTPLTRFRLHLAGAPVAILSAAVLAQALVSCASAEPARQEAIAVREATFMASDGVRLHYRMLGNRGAPVILLHGYLSDGQQNWIATGFAERLARTHRVIVLDQRGHGLSDKPHDGAAYGPRLATDVIALMDHLAIPAAHIGGYSMGGSVVMVLMAEAPERFLSAHIGGGGLPETDPLALEASRALDVSGEDPAEAAMMARRPATAEPDMKAMAAVAAGWEPWVRRDPDLSRIDFPVLVVNGEFDEPHARMSRMRREGATVSTLILPGRTHISAMIDPIYRDRLVAFIDEADRRAAAR